jgi:ring-1,2-phenylacetyl-CoA epoxidase subunit PaaC
LDTVFETPDALNDRTRAAVVDLLYRLADDELIIGHRDSEWTGLGPILEADIAFSSMAQDEMGHAQAYYQLLHELGQAEPDTLAFGRELEDFRCASLVSLPKADWGFSVLRQFLYDTAEQVRLIALAQSAYRPLAHLARKLQSEEKYHLMHGRTWVLRLGDATDESRRIMQDGLTIAYPHALGIFEPTDADQTLAQAGICPRESNLCRQFESAASPVLREAGLTIDPSTEPVYGGRQGVHHSSLSSLLDGMRLVYNTDPEAKW